MARSRSKRSLTSRATERFGEFSCGYRTGMSDDPQDIAEDFDEDVTGQDDPVLSDEAATEYPPEELLGVPFADADVTDESFAERRRQEQPEVWEAVRGEDPEGDSMAADEQLGTIIDVGDSEP